MQSYIFDFEEAPSFFLKWNKEFDVESFDNSTFNIVLVDDICEDNIEDCIDANGDLLYSGEHVLTKECSLRYEHRTNLGLGVIVLDSETVFELLENNFSLKGAFITTSGGYVMGYSINSFGINLTNQVIFEEDLILWDIAEGETHG